MKKTVIRSLPVAAGLAALLVVGAAAPASAAGKNTSVTLYNGSNYRLGWGGFYHDGDYFLVQDTHSDGKGVNLRYWVYNGSSVIASGSVSDLNGANNGTVKKDANFAEGKKIKIKVCQTQNGKPTSHCGEATGTT